jgi:hypothetical protein
LTANAKVLHWLRLHFIHSVLRMSGPKVLYLAGWGRSGTTIVDNVLNGYDTVFSAGELHYLWRRGILGDRACGCGKVLSKCRLWTDILVAAFGPHPPDPRYVVGLQDRALRARHTMGLLGGTWSAEATEYGQILARLYRGIGAVTGASLIVDSSKVPSVAAVIARLPAVESYLLHMVRDARAVAHSWSRKKMHHDRPTAMAQYRPARSTANWLVWNGLVELTARQYGDRYRRLRYEDLVVDPKGSMHGLLDFAEVPVAGDPFLGSHTLRLYTNHTVSGNPGRFQVGEVGIVEDRAWRVDQTVRDRATASVVGLPLLLYYGYPVLSSRRDRHGHLGDPRR